jgi:hypothetical protein
MANRGCWMLFFTSNEALHGRPGLSDATFYIHGG